MAAFTRIVIILSITIALLMLAYYGILQMRKAAQLHFAESHELLSDDDGNAPFQDSALDEKQLKKRDDTTTPITTEAGILPWKTLAQTTMDFRMGTPQITCPASLKALNHQLLRAKGFMFPLDSAGKQRHFLLSPYPSSCAYCLPAGASELIEIRPKHPMDFTYDAVTITGEFELLSTPEDLKQGLFYRMNNATLVTQ